MIRRLFLLTALSVSLGSTNSGPAAATEATEVELRDGRFAVRVHFDDAAHGLRPAWVSSSGQQSAVFHFFDAANPELLIKILDGRTINGHFWVFYGAITTLAVELEVVDQATGTTRRYRKPDGWPLGGADIEAFPSPPHASAAPAAASRADAVAAVAASRPSTSPAGHGICLADATTLCLHGGRFEIRGSWHPEGGPEAAVGVQPGGDRSGTLWFFDSETPEVLVKVLDGRPINGSFWVLYGSATHLPFRMVVTDLETGTEKAFTAEAFGGGADAFTFGPHGEAPSPPEILLPAAGAVVSPHDPPLALDLSAGDEPQGECHDYRIVETSSEGEPLIWQADCHGGPFRGHPAVEDGEFHGQHAATGKLSAGMTYRLLVRRRLPAGLAGPWGSRDFVTGAFSAVYPLPADASVPKPTWTVDEVPVDLSGLGCDLRFEASAAGRLQLIVGDCAQRLVLAPSELRWLTADRRRRSASLPTLDLAAGASRRFHVATGGSTFYADADGVPPILSLARLARHASSPWWLAPGLDIEQIHVRPDASGGFSLPVNLTPGPGLVTPPERAASDEVLFYITELYGAIRVVRRDGSVGTYVDGLLNFDPTGDFPGSGEIGLVGTAVDPANGDLLATTTYQTQPGDDDSPPSFSAKVLRLPSDDGGRTAARVLTVLDLGTETRQDRSHQISHLSFGPDGMLYVQVGDGFASQAAPILDNFAGKILRLHPDGTAPVDNPFYDASDGISAADYVYALGLRNPFGGAWRASDGSLYEVENGLAVDRFARVTAGFDFGWGSGDEGTDEQMTQGALFNWHGAVTPFDLVFVDAPGSVLPAEWAGLALVSEFGPTYLFGTPPRGKRLARFDLDADPIVPRTVVRYDGLGPATVAAVSLVAGTPGHDGLYFLDFFPDHVESPADPSAAGARLWRVFAVDP